MAQDRGGDRPFEVRGYRDVSQIGRGASSTVYRGYDPELSRWVAIKVLLTDDPEDPARKRFKREGEITANLGKHPHIVQVLGTGFTDSSSPYVVMELFEQGSIGDRIRTSGAFTVAETLDIGEKIADAVSAAHRAGVLHRDIKPQNILLSEYGPALGDFGIARTSANLEWSQSLDQLTPMHAAPEILMGGTSTAQSDIYALGSTLYTMLAGRPPFAGAHGEAPLRYQVRVLQDPVPPIPRADIPPSLVEVIERALAKNPADRYHSATDFRDALRSCERQGATFAVATTSPPPARTPGSPLPAPPAAPPESEVATDPAVAYLTEPPILAIDPALPISPAPPTAFDPVTPDKTVTRPNLAASSLPGTNPETASGIAFDLPTMIPPSPDASHIPGTPSPAEAKAPPAAQSAVQAVPQELVEIPLGNALPETGSAGEESELTVQRRISTLDSALSTEPVAAEHGSRQRKLLLAGAAAVVVLAAGFGALFLLGKSTPPKLRIKKEYTITTTNADKPTNLNLVAAGAGATLQWSNPTGAKTQFLVYEISPAGSKVVGVTPAGKTTLSLPGIDPSSTDDCFEVRARIDTDTVGAPAQWCPAGESLSGS